MTVKIVVPDCAVVRGLARDMQERIGPVGVLLEFRDGSRCRQDNQFDLPTLGLVLPVVPRRQHQSQASRTSRVCPTTLLADVEPLTARPAAVGST
jgi:hypothetical protein